MTGGVYLSSKLIILRNSYMKLNDIRPHIETSGELEEQFFSIQDQGMIFDILRNKMYSNPILAICREISCNARDAHREVGTPEIPIHIHLPTSLEPFYKIKDFGPGISPDRMSNIFIKYTASTKRNDNLQTGGFGLGAKTPFSYSDTFTIITNYNGVQYNYACFIDETKVGKLALFSSSPTEEPNGTEIVIPVKPIDFRAFNDWTEHATRHWDVKPVFDGPAFVNYSEMEKILEGDKWAIIASRDYNRTAKMIIDGIEYPLEVETLKKYADAKLIDAAHGHFIMYFDIGELTLSASREQIYLDKMTQDKIRQRLDLIFQDIKERVTTKIDAFSNLWEANVFYRKELTKAFTNLDFLGKLSWKGAPLDNRYVEVSCSVYVFRKGGYSRRNIDPNKLSRSLSHHVNFDETSILFLNDLPIKEPGARHVRKAFDDDPKLETLQVVCPNDKVTADTLNQSINLDKMSPRLLSSITKATGRKAPTTGSSRLLIFKFSGHGGFRQTSYSSLEDDINDKVLCMLTKDLDCNSNREVIFKNTRALNFHDLKDLIDKHPNVSFYGVDSLTPRDRIEEDLSDLEDFEEFVTKKVLTKKHEDYVAIKWANGRHPVNFWGRDSLKRMSSLITDPNSLFLKRLAMHQHVDSLGKSDKGFIRIYEMLNGEITDSELKKFLKDHPECDVTKMESEFLSKYPLLSHISYYSAGAINIDNHLSKYINLIDQE